MQQVNVKGWVTTNQLFVLRNTQSLSSQLTNALIDTRYDEESPFPRNANKLTLSMPTDHAKPHWILIVLAWTFGFLNTIRAIILRLLPKKRRKYRFTWDVSIEVLSNGRHSCRNAAALIDTGCPKDLMSRDFARILGDPFQSFDDLTLETLAGTEFNSIGQVAGRWCCFESPRSWFNFPPKYMESVWHVGEETAGFDIIIGSETINKYRLLERVILAAPAGVRALHKVDPSTEAVRKQQEKDREENLKKEREDREQKRREEEQRKRQTQNAT